MRNTNNPEALLEFPCHYTFKAVGISDSIFTAQVCAVVRRHATAPQDAIKVRPSAKGNYQSVSIYVRLESYQQLTDIYAGLKEVPGLKMLL